MSFERIAAAVDARNTLPDDPRVDRYWSHWQPFVRGMGRSQRCECFTNGIWTSSLPWLECPDWRAMLGYVDPLDEAARRREQIRQVYGGRS